MIKYRLSITVVTVKNSTSMCHKILIVVNTIYIPGHKQLEVLRDLNILGKKLKVYKAALRKALHSKP